MGNSFVGIGKRGFWANDGVLDLFAAAIARTIDTMEGIPDWLRVLRNDLARNVQCSAPGLCGIDFEDAVGTDAVRVQQLISIIERSRAWLLQKGEVLEPAVLHEILRPFSPPAGDVWTRGLPNRQLDPFYSAVLAVIRGDDLTGIQSKYIS